MKVANLRENIEELRKKYAFEEDTFKYYFGLSYQDLINMRAGEHPLVYSEATEKSVFLTETFRVMTPDESLLNLINILHTAGKLSYQTIALYAQLQETEIIDYIHGKNKLSIEDKYNCFSRLAVLNSFISLIIKNSEY